MIVRSALNEALRYSFDAYGREELLAALFRVREEREFSKVRERIEELKLLTMSPTRESEERAKSLIAEIDGEATTGYAEHFGMGRNVVIGPAAYPRIATTNPDDFLIRLYTVFPELRPLAGMQSRVLA